MEISPFYLNPISRRKRIAPEMAAFNVVIRHVEAESRSRIKEEDISVFGGKQKEGGYSCPEREAAQSSIFYLFEPNHQSQS